MFPHCICLGTARPFRVGRYAFLNHIEVLLLIRRHVYSRQEILLIRDQPSPTTRILTSESSLGVARLRTVSFLNSGFGRLLRFGVVGGTTGLVQLAMLQALKSVGIAAVPAYALGLLVSCQVNFTLNTFLVWGDRPIGSNRLRALARRWAAYHACIALAVALNFGVFVLAREYVHDIAAAVIAIGASTLVKFFLLDRLAFKDETL